MKVFKYDEVPSTQDLAKSYLNNNFKKAVFIASSQSRGYGKQGRFFYSPNQTGIYYSLALPNFEIAKEKAGLLTPYIALKIVEVLKQYFPKKNFFLKWVNDIYFNNKKIAGILTEKFDTGLVVGVGININTTNFPEELKKIVGSIGVGNYNRKQLIEDLIRVTETATQDYNKVNFLTSYRELSNVIGRQIEFKNGKEEFKGFVENIDDNGNLVVKIAGKKRTFTSGEITKIRFD